MDWFIGRPQKSLQASRIYGITAPRVGMNPIYLKYHDPLCQEL